MGVWYVPKKIEFATTFADGMGWSAWLWLEEMRENSNQEWWKYSRNFVHCGDWEVID